MVAASSYQNDGRAAPLKLTAAANTPTIRESRRPNTPLCCQKRGARLLTDQAAGADVPPVPLVEVGFFDPGGPPVRPPPVPVTPPTPPPVTPPTVFVTP